MPRPLILLNESSTGSQDGDAWHDLTTENRAVVKPVERWTLIATLGSDSQDYRTAVEWPTARIKGRRRSDRR
jgi:hypothetical protein